MTKFKNGGTGKSEVSTRLFTGPHERAPTVHLRHHTNFDLFLAEKSLDAIKKNKSPLGFPASLESCTL